MMASAAVQLGSSRLHTPVAAMIAGGAATGLAAVVGGALSGLGSATLPPERRWCRWVRRTQGQIGQHPSMQFKARGHPGRPQRHWAMHVLPWAQSGRHGIGRSYRASRRSHRVLRHRGRCDTPGPCWRGVWTGGRRPVPRLRARRVSVASPAVVNSCTACREGTLWPPCATGLGVSGREFRLRAAADVACELPGVEP